MSKLSKRLLSWLLLAAMLCTLLPTAVFAEDADVLEPAEDTAEYDAVTGEQLSPDTDEPETYALDEGLEAQTVADDEDVSTQTITLGEKPADGTTTENPFIQGTAGSNSFRIPAMVTLSDGTLVAAADARWNTTYDGGGLDTIVSRSTDNGANWSYTFANYLGDNGNEYNGSSSTCFIDPALVVTEGNTIYMLCDLYPYGVALNGDKETKPVTTKGFNDSGYLMLKGTEKYNAHIDYYLKDGKIYTGTLGIEVSGYTVDDHFNLYKNGTYVSNLFFSDSPYKVVRTGYLYLTKSEDKGATWSAPTLLNLKTDSEQVCLVGPGRGLYASDGTIVFPVYSYNGEGTQKMGFIYSTDGSTWNRSGSFTGATWSSESAVVELENGKLRFFYRNGTTKLCYVDYDWASGWGSAVETEVATNSNCQISAITYSKELDGKQMILVSCPAGENDAGSSDSSASARKNGKIFVFAADSNGNMELKNTVAVDSVNSEDSFMYSCLTELKDGGVALLYEDNESKWGTGDDCYYQMSYKTFTAEALGLTSNGANNGTVEGGSGETTIPTKEVTINLTVGDPDKTVEVSGENLAGNVNRTDLDTGVATVDVKGQDASEFTKVTVTCYEVCKSNTNYKDTDYYYLDDDGQHKKLYVTRTENKYYGTYTYYYKKSSNSNYPSNSQYTAIETQTVKTPQSATPNIDIYTKATTPASTTITFTPVAEGTTYVTVGDTKYIINVTPKTETINVSMQKDNTRTLTPADMPNDGSVIYSVTEGTDVVTVNNGTVIANKEGNATVVATVKTAAGYTYAIYTYNITVANGEAIQIKVGETQRIETVTLQNGQYVKWTTGDSQYVGVAGAYDSVNHKETNEAILAGYAVTDSPVVVTGIVYDKDGNVVSTKKWLVTVVAGDKDTNTTERYIYVEVKEIQNCTVYYSINGRELKEIEYEQLGDGVVGKILLNYTDGSEKGAYKGHFNIMFFAAPNEGYALTDMHVAGSDNQYYTLSNGSNPDGTDSDAWPLKAANANEIPADSKDSRWKSDHGFRWPLIEGNMTLDQMRVLFSQAIALGCDGVTSFTKNEVHDDEYSGDYYTVVQFIAQKLPTVEKEIVSITKNGETAATPYQPGMTVSRGDTINYKITVTKPAKQTSNVYQENSYNSKRPIVKEGNRPIYGKGDFNEIGYSDEELTDTLTSSQFYKNEGMTQQTSIQNTLGTSEESEKKYYYYTKLELTDDKFVNVITDGQIVNEVELNYTYKSKFSSGSLSSKSNAVATVTPEMPTYVIDFGLPVTLSIPQYFGTGYDIKEASADYGTCVVNNNDKTGITYTPSKVLTGADYVKLTVQKNNGDAIEKQAIIAVYPANNVLYEETFATVDENSGWNTVDKANANTTQSVSGDGDIYGYDKAYATDNNTYSNGSAYKATLTADGESPHAQFTFKGTGLEIMGECGANTGTLVIGVTNASDKGTRVYIVDTHFNGQLTNGDETVTIEGGMTYQIPVVHDLSLLSGEHTVDIYGSYPLSSSASKTQNAQVAVQLASDGTETVSELDAFLAEIGYEGAEVEYISMNEVLGGYDEGVAVYANQVADADSTTTTATGPVVYFDGFRVYNTLDTEPTAYVESEAEFTSLYDVVSESKWDNETNSGQGLVYVEKVEGASTAYDSYKNSGPQNEIYLGKGEAIAFKVNTNREEYSVQVSAKAIEGIPTLNNENTKIDTQTEMYYDVTANVENGLVVIMNNSNNTILSLVDLKIIGGTLDTQSTITAAQVEAAIYNLQNPKPAEPDDSGNGGNEGNEGDNGKLDDTDQPGDNGKPDDTGKPGDTDQPDDTGKPGDNGNTGKPDDPTENWQNPFTDVNMQAWYAPAIRYLSSRGIVNGLPGGIFGTENDTTRSMVITMLYRLAKSPEVEGKIPFDDVPEEAWYADAALWAYQTGIVKGYAEGNNLLFKPDQAITRQEFVTMLYRFVTDYKKMTVSLSSNLNTYGDKNQVQSWAQDAMKWAVDNGIMNGYNEGKNWFLKPTNKTKRSEMAKLFYGLYGYLGQN